MAPGPLTQLADLVVLPNFQDYITSLTLAKTEFVTSGVVRANPLIDTALRGTGPTFTIPGWHDLDDDPERISTQTPSILYGGPTDPTPNKVATFTQVGVRLSRNNSWSESSLAEALSRKDPLGFVASRVADYWARRLQLVIIATIQGVFADNAAAPVGTEHVINDLSLDVSGGAYTAGVTDFTAANFINAITTAGDAAGQFTTIMVHSTVYARMQKNNLITFIPQSRGEVQIATFLGRRVIVDDGMPRTGNIYETWILREGAIALGIGSPQVPVELQRHPGAGNGGGQEVLYNRVEWCVHPMGYSFTPTPADGGPANDSLVGNLAHVATWQRRYRERKQIGLCRLITREA